MGSLYLWSFIRLCGCLMMTLKGLNITTSIPVQSEEGTYTDGENDLLQECVTWNHSLREVINSLIQSGLTISSFDEFDYSPYNCFSQTVECEPNKYRIKHLSNHIPMVYSIIATK